LYFVCTRKQEPRTPAIQDLDDDSASVQSQETDKQPSDTPSSLSKSSNASKESTPQPNDDLSSKNASEDSSVNISSSSSNKETPENEKKVSHQTDDTSLHFSNTRTLFEGD
jgi:hypothetical protein